MGILPSGGGGSKKDLHSRVFGETVHNTIPNECHLLSVFVDKDTKILVPEVDRYVSILNKLTKTLLSKFVLELVQFAHELKNKRQLRFMSQGQRPSFRRK